MEMTLAVDRVGERGPSPLVGHMDELQADPGPQQFVGQVRTAALARRSDGDRLHLLARHRQQLLQRIGREGRMGHHHLGRRADQGDRREALHRIVLCLGVHRRIDAVGHVSVEQRIAVGRRARDDLRAEHARRAGPVVDDHGEARGLLQLLRDQAPGEIGAAARRVRHHEADGL